MLGVMGNGIIRRLIGIEILRFVLAKIPSVGLTSQLSNFLSADRRCRSLRMRCHLSSGTGSNSIEFTAARQLCRSAMEQSPEEVGSERSIAISRENAQMPMNSPPFVKARASLSASHSAARLSSEG